MGKEKIVGFYYGSISYENFSSGGSRMNTHGKSILRVPKETVMKWASRLPHSGTDRNTVQHSVLILPAPCCAMLNVNDGRYL